MFILINKMNLDDWIELIENKLSKQEISLPLELSKSKLSKKEATSWIFYETDVKEYYNYFPIYISMPGHEIRIYYVNVNTKSKNYHKISCLRLLCGYIPVIDLDRESWEEFKKHEMLFDKIIAQ